MRICAIKMVVDKSAEKSDNYVSGNHSAVKPKALPLRESRVYGKEIYPISGFFGKVVRILFIIWHFPCSGAGDNIRFSSSYLKLL